MTTPTREELKMKATSALGMIVDGYDKMMQVGAYITHLEANQRTEISDDAVRDAMENLNRDSVDWHTIKQALSEREAHKARVMELEEALKSWRIPRHQRECVPSNGFCSDECEANKRAWKLTCEALKAKDTP